MGRNDDQFDLIDLVWLVLPIFQRNIDGEGNPEARSYRHLDGLARNCGPAKPFCDDFQLSFADDVAMSPEKSARTDGRQCAVGCAARSIKPCLGELPGPKVVALFWVRIVKV